MAATPVSVERMAPGTALTARVQSPCATPMSNAKHTTMAAIAAGSVDSRTARSSPWRVMWCVTTRGLRPAVHVAGACVIWWRLRRVCPVTGWLRTMDKAASVSRPAFGSVYARPPLPKGNAAAPKTENGAVLRPRSVRPAKVSKRRTVNPVNVPTVARGRAYAKGRPPGPVVPAPTVFGPVPSPVGWSEWGIHVGDT